MREAGAFWGKREEVFSFHSSRSDGRRKRGKEKLNLFQKKLFTPPNTAPVTELHLPERIEEVLLPSAVRVPGFEGIVSADASLEDKKNKKSASKKKKPGDGDDDKDGEKAAKRRRLENKKKKKLRASSAAAGGSPARSIAWNRYGTLLAGKRRKGKRELEVKREKKKKRKKIFSLTTSLDPKKNPKNSLSFSLFSIFPPQPAATTARSSSGTPTPAGPPAPSGPTGRRPPRSARSPGRAAGGSW